ncbi:hypothetical protein CEUSTIGMA_g9419.t1 [Chlamydomonas eustigma]|uniref:Carbohydrate kinase PfkB domain-containing protein n=1 Tax=Chlamydomonas eustigma TaxID=1157962 RepID=A0A250XFZ1_9CHLO|nr:hypothetical protein CEUSTIGMA_g9419.t1 [Chlamydomonas eustigma]|eukprot:GAX81991.1 hypothetical protein CEUSTIGMA_g9419.t1 [Chlamydomonas eustigma]
MAPLAAEPAFNQQVDMVDVITIQPSAIVDHLCHVTASEMASVFGPQEIGGARRCSMEELRSLLDHFSGVMGSDSWGKMFLNSLERSGVCPALLRVAGNSGTGQCMVMTDAATGQRTMRTAMSSDCILEPDMVHEIAFQGSKWIFLSAYSIFKPGLLTTCAKKAKSQGVKAMLDLSSWETGCIAGSRVDEHLELHHEPACPGLKVVDTTGAGDAFSSGFLYGLLKGLPLSKCANIGCVAGAAAIQSLGSELGHDQLLWLHQNMHSKLAGSVVSMPALEIYKELLDVYALLGRVGVGVVYFGSARLTQSSLYWDMTVSLAHDISSLLHAPAWTGGGPGLMHAATLGAQQAGGIAAGIRISRESGQTIYSAGYLPEGSTVTCKHMPVRKAALADCGLRQKETDRTAYIFLPGGEMDC